MKKMAIFLGLAMTMSSAAKADIMILLNSGPVISGTNFKWLYTVTLKSGSTLNNGDFFTIYDIGGFGVQNPIPLNVVLPAGSNWSYSVQFEGTDGFSQAPVDSNIGYNLTYRYIGASPIVANVDTILGSPGAFGYTSSHNTSLTGAYSATTHNSSGGALAGNTSTVTVAGGPYDAIFRDNFE